MTAYLEWEHFIIDLIEDCFTESFSCFFGHIYCRPLSRLP